MPKTASVRQIERQFRTISRQIHPDKQVPQQARVVDPDLQGFVPSPSSDELTQRNEIFLEVQKAYGYLTNPLTKIIYDEYGVTGLSVYEKSKPKFQDL